MDKQVQAMQSDFNRYYANEEAAFGAGITAACILVQSSSLKLVPVDTGLLRKSIRYQVVKLTGTVGTSVEYAPFQEFGTSKMESQPFLKPALDMNVQGITRLITSALQRVAK